MVDRHDSSGQPPNIEKEEYVKEIIVLHRWWRSIPSSSSLQGDCGCSDVSRANIRNNDRSPNMREDDELINVLVTNGHQTLLSVVTMAMLWLSRKQMPVLWADSDRGTGWNCVRVTMLLAAVLNPESNVLVVTERGYGEANPEAASMLLRTEAR